MTTDWNLLKTGLMAIEASIQLKCNTGLDMVGVLSSKGSIIRTKPEEKKISINYLNNIIFKVYNKKMPLRKSFSIPFNNNTCENCLDIINNTSVIIHFCYKWKDKELSPLIIANSEILML